MFSKSELYKSNLKLIASIDIEWQNLTAKNILITGATGLIGTFLIDLLMYRNYNYNNNITIYAIGRNKDKALIRFREYFDSENFIFLQYDIQKNFQLDIPIDYIIHGASNTHPVSYATEPINTILLSVLGTKNILDFAAKHNVKRVLFLSTVEIYGENRGDVDFFTEEYCGYLNSNTLRSGYPEGKRACEALCQAYIAETKLDIVIARCCRVFGPTMQSDDSKVIAQFIRNIIKNENIILKSKGDQQYSYCYVADICSALIILLLHGKNSEAYNISDMNANLSLFEIATILAKYANKKICFDVPSSVEYTGYSKATKALLDSNKLMNLGWKPLFSITDGLFRTIEILRNDKKTF